MGMYIVRQVVYMILYILIEIYHANSFFQELTHKVAAK